MSSLSNSTSPYLQLRASDRVNWVRWSDQAIASARKNKQHIHLLLGYYTSTRAHFVEESVFNDPRVADALNQSFINIIVDKDETPELEQLATLQPLRIDSSDENEAFELNNDRITIFDSAFWPRTLFLDPFSLKVDFSLVIKSRPGVLTRADTMRTGYLAVVAALEKERISVKPQFVGANFEPVRVAGNHAFAQSHGNLQKQEEQLRLHWGRRDAVLFGASLHHFGSVLRYFLAVWYETKDSSGSKNDVLDEVLISATKLARSAIYDHIHGGFFNSNVQSFWHRPKFEKHARLNADLLMLYCDMWRTGGDTLFKHVCEQTAEYLLSTRNSESRAFLHAKADLSAVQPTQFSWSRHEIKQSLNDEEYLFAATLYGADRRSTRSSRFFLSRQDSWHSTLNRLSLDHDRAEALLTSLRRKLAAIQESKLEVTDDTRTFTAANAKVIAALFLASETLDRPEFGSAAQETLDYIISNTFALDRLSHQVGEPTGRTIATLEDYSAMLEAINASLRFHWSDERHSVLKTLIDQLFDLEFWNESLGLFRFNGSASEFAGIFEIYPMFYTDQTIPAIESLCQVLVKSQALYDKRNLIEIANRSIQTLALNPYPRTEPNFYRVKSFVESPFTSVFLYGETQQALSWTKTLNAQYDPHTVCYVVPDSSVIVRLNSERSGRMPHRSSGLVVAAVHCRDTVQHHNLETFDALKRLLNPDREPERRAKRLILRPNFTGAD